MFRYGSREFLFRLSRLLDVSLAVHHREVKAREQHTHSFLEVLPFMGLAFAACLHGDATRRLLTGRTCPGDWKLQLKKERLPSPYLVGIYGLIAVGVHYLMPMKPGAVATARSQKEHWVL